MSESFFSIVFSSTLLFPSPTESIVDNGRTPLGHLLTIDFFVGSLWMIDFRVLCGMIRVLLIHKYDRPILAGIYVSMRPFLFPIGHLLAIFPVPTLNYEAN